MNKFVKFLIPFAPFFISYITIVGAGRGVKNVAGMKYSANGTTVEIEKKVSTPVEGDK